MQRALSRILTDQDFQRSFLAGDPAAREAYQLTARERDSLLGMRWDRVRQHSQLLAIGRVELGLKGLPLTQRVLHHRLRDLVERFCAEHPPATCPGGLLIVEANRVCDFVGRLVAGGELEPAYAADIAAYERAVLYLGNDYDCWQSAVRVAELAAATPTDPRHTVPVGGPHLALLPFDHPLPELIARLEAGEVPRSVPRLDRPMWMLLHKLPGEMEVRHVRVNEPTADLVRACDGRRSLARVLEMLESSYGEGIEPAALSTLDRLVEIGAIGLRPLG